MFHMFIDKNDNETEYINMFTYFHKHGHVFE